MKPRCNETRKTHVVLVSHQSSYIERLFSARERDDSKSKPVKQGVDLMEKPARAIDSGRLRTAAGVVPEQQGPGDGVGHPVGDREEVPRRGELVVHDPRQLPADVPRQADRHDQVLGAVPQVHLPPPPAAGERVLQLQRAPAPAPEPDHHVPVQALVLPLLPDLRLRNHARRARTCT